MNTDSEKQFAKIGLHMLGKIILIRVKKNFF